MRALLIGLLSFGVIGGYGSAIAHVAHARGGCHGSADGRFGGGWGNRGWDNRFAGDPRSGWAQYDDGRVQRFQLVDEARPAAPAAAPSNAPVVINNSPAPAAAAPAPIIVVVPQGATYPVTVPAAANTQASAQQ
jgi:hypothetical protein